jgi:ubiquinone/menaquinone biosynthesis C-methylase UbiE
MMDKEIELPIYKELLGRLHNNIANIQGTLVDTSCGSGHMLAMFRSQYDPNRSLVGIDLSPRMVALSSEILGKDSLVKVGDMRSLTEIDSGSAAAVISFFAIHHLDSDGVHMALQEWKRVLVQGGYLIVAAWEGTGPIDYGEESDIVALRYTGNELTQIAVQAGLTVTQCNVKPVDGFQMDAVHLECIRK